MEDFMAVYADSTPRIHVRLYASISARVEDWERFAVYFDANREIRLAQTIRTGVKRQKERGWTWGWITLRFRGGSIDKIVDNAERVLNV